jgi:hypothetical protein
MDPDEYNKRGSLAKSGRLRPVFRGLPTDPQRIVSRNGFSFFAREG